MAKKFKKKTGNCKPTSAVNKLKTLGYSGGGSATIPDIIRNVWNEVGRTGFSTLPGIDQNGVPIKAITYASRDPLMFRYEYPDAIADYDDSNADTVLSSILSSNYYYEQDTDFRKKGKKQIPRFERYCRPDITYDEEYFQHIFNWPTSHTLRERKVGGFIEEQIVCTTTTANTAGEGEPSNSTTSTSTTYVMHTPTANYNGSFSLDKIESELYYIDDKWGYQPLVLDSAGRITDEAVSDRIGEPIIYHGGTDDDKLFFHYVLQGEGTPESVGTSNLVAIGDTINGATVTNIVNYVVDVALKRTVSRHSRKNINSVQEPAFLKLNSADGIAIGNTITGKGIRSGTTITSVDESSNRVYLSQAVSRKKVKVVKIFDTAVNRVSKNTLCYAEISGGSFAADATYSVLRGGQSTGITVCARAGKGIINRSAIVGTYFSKGKKEIEYRPLFYSADDSCEKIYLEDDNSKYVLGTLTYDDGSKLDGKWISYYPKTELAYKISSIYLSFTNGPVDKDSLERWINYYNQGNNLIELYQAINAHIISTLNGKKVAEASDDSCRDEIVVEYTQVYDPYMEINDFDNVPQAVEQSLIDCVPRTEEPPAEIDEVKDRISDFLSNSINNSTVLTEDYYKLLVSNKDSLLNKLKSSTTALSSSIPKKTKVDNLPPQIEGEDSSGIIFRSKNYRDLPPGMDRIKFFIHDVNIGSDKDLNPVLDLDPETTVNQPKIIIRSKPCWVWNNNMNRTVNTSHASGGGAFTSTFTITVNNSGGFADTITTAEGTVEPASATVTTGGGDGDSTTCVYTRYWVSPGPKSLNDNITFGEHKEPWDLSKVSSSQSGYTSATNWSVHPSLRDLDNVDRSEDSDISSPNAIIYPKTIWAPGINYQRDFHKMFYFRTEELAENIAESVENGGNPYLDNPVTAKLTQTLNPSDTTIHVQSTDGFLSTGYLIIPKYVKKVAITETGNKTPEFTYCGEEIIYYTSKTSTSFTGCERECFGTSSDFEVTVPSAVIETGTRYKITSVGTTNWQSIGAPEGATVGTVFVATDSAVGSGTATVFGSTDGAIASDNSIYGINDPARIPVMTSYERGFSVTQHWIFRIKED